MVNGIIFIMVFGTIILWIAAEWKTKFLFRILAGVFLFCVLHSLFDFCFISPLQEKIANTRLSNYEAVRSIISLLEKGEEVKVKKALTAFVETQCQWDDYQRALVQLVQSLTVIDKETKGKR